MRCGDFCPDTCCVTLQLKVLVITLRRKSARRGNVILILYGKIVTPYDMSVKRMSATLIKRVEQSVSRHNQPKLHKV